MFGASIDTTEFDTFASRHQVDVSALPEIHILETDLVRFTALTFVFFSHIDTEN